MSRKYLLVNDGTASSVNLILREDGENVGTVDVVYEDDALRVTVARVDEAATGPVELVVR